MLKTANPRLPCGVMALKGPEKVNYHEKKTKMEEIGLF